MHIGEKRIWGGGVSLPRKLAGSLYPFIRCNCGESLCVISLSSLLIRSDVLLTLLLERARTSPSFSGKGGGQRHGEIPRNFELSKVVRWHFEWTDDNSMAEFRMAEGEKVVVVKIIINFSWIGKCIEYYKKLHFSTHSRRINPISLKRSTPTKHDILAAILSRGSRLQRDRVAAMNVTRVPLKFFKETVDRVSWRSDVGPLRLFHRWDGKSLFAGRV